MKQKSNYGNRRQQGIALPIIMIILVLAALVTIYTTTTSVKEQQVTADQYRSVQAFSTAQAGVDFALERHNQFEDFDGTDTCGNTGLSPEETIVSDCTDFSDSVKGSFSVMFCDIWDEGKAPAGVKDLDGDKSPFTDDDNDGYTSASLMADFLTDTHQCTNPINPGNLIDADGFRNDARVGILSVGKPDDASGRRTISVVSAPAPLLRSGGFDFLPLSARGFVAVTGSIAVINRYRNLNIWSGEEIDVGSAAVGTFVNDGTLKRSDYSDTLIEDRDYRLAMTDITMTPDLLNAMLSSNSDTGINSDIVDNDFNLVNMSGDDMFEAIFSADKGTIRNYAIAVGNGNIFTVIGDIVDTPEKTGLLWLESTSSVAINSGSVGTFDEPAFLIVDLTGAVDPTFTISNDKFYGLIFVFGNVMLLGGPEIYGSIIATGSVGVAHNAAGGGTIVYDPEGLVVDPEGLSGLRGIEPGTWKDWGYVN